MKKIIILFVICFSLSKLQAQVISPEIITSDGGFYANSAAMLSFTEGVVVDFCSLKQSNSIINLGIVPNSIKIYPNPASDFITLNINNKNAADISLTIYTSIGTLVKSELLRENNQRIYIGDLSCGVYIVALKSKDLTENKKLIIQR
jgi:hypothetical protein